MPIFSAGASGSHRLGRDHNFNTPSQVNVKTTNMVCLATGWRHNIVIYQDGTAVGWGDDDDFQMGTERRSEFQDPTPIQALRNVHLIWAHAGDKRTTYLAHDGGVYITCSSCQNHAKKMKINAPCVYVSSGVAKSYAIDNAGNLYECADPNDIPTKHTFVRPVYDVAAGADFVITVTVDGVAYGSGKLNTTSNSGFAPIPSLEGTTVYRVFGYNGHAAVITSTGRVMTWGNGGAGRLGHGNEVPLNRFELIQALEDVRIVDLDMGDAHTIFVSENGDVYGCGASDDGRLMLHESHNHLVPTKSTYISGKAVFVRCGCFHTDVVVDEPPLIHPGVRTFLNFVSNDSSRQIIFGGKLINTSIGALASLNLMPGDMIFAESKNSFGFVVGVDGSMIATVIDNTKMLISSKVCKFQTRKNYIGVPAKTVKEEIMCDGGDIIKSFGLETGDIVEDKEKNLYEVLGLCSGVLWFSHGGYAQYLPKGTVENIFSHFHLFKSRRNTTSLKIGNIVYPVEMIEAFYLHSNKGARVIAEFGVSYVVKPIIGDYFFIPKKNCRKSETNDMFYSYDRVLYEDEAATILAINGDFITIITESDLCNGGNGIIVNSSNLQLIARVAGPCGIREIGDKKYDVNVAKVLEKNCLPSDLFVTKEGIIEIIGMYEDEVYGIRYGEETPIVVHPESMTLIQRSFDIGSVNRIISVGHQNTSISVYTNQMYGTGFLQGDAIKCDDMPAVVLGIGEGYIWLADTETNERFCIYADSCERMKLLSRPSNSHFELFE